MSNITNSKKRTPNTKIKNDSIIKQNYSESYLNKFPSTRYQGSKAKIVDWIWENIKDIPFNTVLDAFGGTGCVAYMLKCQGKCVTYNDILKFNFIIGEALIENNNVIVDKDDLNFILTKHENIKYPTFIQDNFKDIFYLDEENVWLDMVIKNINEFNNEYKRYIAWFALFQACIIKRPFSLFHRANLYIRTSNVKRSFGNKTTWDKPFSELFVKFIGEANAAIFDNRTDCRALNCNVFDLPTVDYDLIYIDTPYISEKGVGVDYIDFYHFLEGMCDYMDWENKLLNQYKHLPIKGKDENIWAKKKEIHGAFEKLIQKYSNSTLVISYRSDGIPSRDEIKSLLSKYKKNVIEIKCKDYKYALAHKKTSEILFIAK